MALRETRRAFFVGANVLQATFFHPEGARYAAPLVLLPGLWAGPEACRGVASYLAHRGWECHVLDLRSHDGGVAARAADIVAYVRRLPALPVLIGHDAGALAALAVAAQGIAAGVVLLAPLVPASGGARAVALRPAALPALLLGRRVPPPAGHARRLLLSGLPAAARELVAATLGPESPIAVLDVARGRVDPAPLGRVPGLLLGGSDDLLLPPAAALALAGDVGATYQRLPDSGHWLLAGPAWQRTVGLVHRWIVQQLGEPLLDLYAETMAERDADGEDGPEDP
jgi:alpha-beta hydrolase superfamily lysophospholipase